jgi:protocatechuate 3,4-dioxygenase beta subunit
MKPTRRVFLKQAGKVSFLVISHSLWQPLIASAEVEATPPNAAGPYYVPGAPLKSNLRETGDHGQPIVVRGRLIDTKEKPLANGRIEIWHSNPEGAYDMSGFRYRASVPISSGGDYEFKTFLPGHYGSRPQHIHFRISSAGNPLLFTQLYFENDPFFEGNPKKTYTKDSVVRYPQLIRPVISKNLELFVFFQIAIRQVEGMS